MAITVLCPQGHLLTIDDPQRDHACPRCGSVLACAPATAPELPALPGALAARPESRKRRDEDEDEDDRPRRRKPRDDDEDEDDDRPRRRKDERVKAGPPVKRRAAQPEPEDDDDEDDEDEAGVRKLTRRQRQFSMVRLGIIFHMIKFWLILAGLLFGLVTLPLILFLAMMDNILSKILLQICYGFSITAAPLAGVVGSILCAWAPPRSLARGTSIVSMIFDILAPCFGLFQLLMWTGFFMTADDRLGRLLDYMQYARMTCTIVAWWLFQLYLRKLSFFMRETLLASESLNVIVHLLMATVVTPALLVATVMVFLFAPGLLVLILFFATLGWMIFFSVTFPVRQMRLLMLVRQKIWDKYLKPDDD